MTRITRRTVGALAAGAASSLAMPWVRRANAAGELRIFTWEGYAEKPWVEAFEKATGAKANVAYTGSVDEMFAKVQGSDGADFDVLAFDTGSFKRYLEQKLIQPIDMAKVPNAKNLLPSLQNVAAVHQDGATYGLPFAWGSLPLVYDKKAFTDGAPDSWGVMWDPANAQQLIALDDANNSIVNAAIYMGIKTPYNLNDDQFQAVKAKLIEQKPLLLTYFAGYEDGVNAFADNGVKAMFSMGEPQVGMLQKKGVDAAMVIPKEGAIGWLDCWNISKGCRDLGLATAWMDIVLSPEVGTYLSSKLGYGNTTNAEANTAAGMTYADKLIYLEAPEDFQKRTEIWNEVKAAPV
ncbi:MAG: extracellular solute-binding protein [Geminicoccaceae bacterium]